MLMVGIQAKGQVLLVEGVQNFVTHTEEVGARSQTSRRKARDGFRVVSHQGSPSTLWSLVIPLKVLLKASPAGAGYRTRPSPVARRSTRCQTDSRGQAEMLCQVKPSGIQSGHCSQQRVSLSAETGSVLLVAVYPTAG